VVRPAFPANRFILLSREALVGRIRADDFPSSFRSYSQKADGIFSVLLCQRLAAANPVRQVLATFGPAWAPGSYGVSWGGNLPLSSRRVLLRVARLSFAVDNGKRIVRLLSVNAPDTSAGTTPDLQLEIAHLLFIDVVGYTKLLVNEQIELLQQLNQIVRNTECFRTAEANGKLGRVPTGDGMALLFFRSPEEPARCALEISRALQDHTHVQLRMGIHSGPVNRVADVNDKTNFAGAGINIAQRVLDCGDAGHILLSAHIADDLANYRYWQPYLHDLGECEVKHGLRLHLFNLYKENLGNPQVPGKLKCEKGSSQASAIRSLTSPRWPKIALAAALLISAAAVVISSVIFFHRPSHLPAIAARPETKAASWPTAIPEKSIAVLPFENLSDEKENAYFADGVQDEILTGLAKVADLKVISRTSTLQYRGNAGHNLREIAEALGVAHVLAGSVQRAGDRVRVSAQLIDARTDAQLWAERYDRDIADVFAIESELAGKIVAQLRSKLSPEEKAAIEEQPTADLAAYELYAHAKTLIDNALSSSPSKDLLEAIQLLDQAVKHDPSFFLAYYQLAHAHDMIYHTGFDHTPERLALADSAIQSLRRLRPDAGETHLALAEHFYRGQLDYDRARQELTAAQQALPNNALAFLIAAYIDRRQGRWEDSIRNFEHASELDPRNVVILQQLSVNYEYLRRYSEMATTLDRALAIAPNDVSIRAQRAGVALSSHADTKPLRAIIQTILAENPNAAPLIADQWLTLALCERDSGAATRALAALRPTGCYEAAIPFPNSWGEGLAARLRGDQPAAHAAFTTARRELEQMLHDQPDYAQALSALGVIDASLGNKEDAIREGRQAVQLMPVSKNAVEGPLLIKCLAVIYAWTFENDRALKRLEEAAKLPGYLSYGELRLHPKWDPLRGDPRFEKIVAYLAPKE
jgi:TolB-like protein/class 3 adenylate cyclase/Tfp pilus assembly protein PilF